MPVVFLNSWAFVKIHTNEKGCRGYKTGAAFFLPLQYATVLHIGSNFGTHPLIFLAYGYGYGVSSGGCE